MLFSVLPSVSWGWFPRSEVAGSAVMAAVIFAVTARSPPRGCALTLHCLPAASPGPAGARPIQAERQLSKFLLHCSDEQHGAPFLVQGPFLLSVSCLVCPALPIKLKLCTVRSECIRAPETLLSRAELPCESLLICSQIDSLLFCVIVGKVFSTSVL